MIVLEKVFGDIERHFDILSGNRPYGGQVIGVVSVNLTPVEPDCPVLLSKL